jgi:hypothetical protein
MQLSLNKHRFAPAIVLGLCLCFFSCEKKEKTAQDTGYFAEVLVQFLNPEGEYKARVMFFADSLQTARPLKMEHGVRFQGQAMREKAQDASAFRYERILPGPYQAQQLFEYTDPEGKKQEIALEMEPIADFELKSPISKSTGSTLSLKNGSLGAEESLLLLFTDEKGASFYIEKNGPAEASAIPLSAQELQTIPPGNYEVYLVKKQARRTEDEDHTVFSVIEYYSSVRAVRVVE